ncbi:MAG: AAA family ATPase [Oscillospiraceae bacterium]
MKIRKMSASFGVLENKTMELSEGLNIVVSPNESGKSTWCGFIRAMLFGIDSAAREKGGIKPDKTKFAPWSGAPMAGTMDVSFRGNEITLARQGRESAPMREFSASLRGSRDAAPQIPKENPGEALVGVPADVFERSAFIGQGAIAVGASPELERRIAAIVQTGEENSSFTEAEERLKAAMRRRRFNKSGKLPELEAQISETRQSITDIDNAAQRGEELQAAKAQAIAKRDAAYENAQELRRLQRRESLDKLTGSRNHVKALENDCKEKSAKLAEAERRLAAQHFGDEPPLECEKRVDADLAAINRLEVGAKKGGNSLVWLIAISALLALALGVSLFLILGKNNPLSYIPAAIVALFPIIQLFRLFALRKRRKAMILQKNQIFGQYNCDTTEEISELLKTHKALWSARELALENRRRAEEALAQAEKEQQSLDAELLRDLDFSGGEGDAARQTRELSEAETALRQIREDAAAWQGKISGLGDRAELEARLSDLVSQHENVTLEYEALALAAGTLLEAGSEIQSRLTPKLSRQTAEYFAKLTGNRYDAVVLDSKLRAEARITGEPVSREAAFLSLGAADQLYLAVRLAICELALPQDDPCPLIFDDALVNFDDERCKLALELLHEISKKRQIILFSCQNREAEQMSKFSDVNILRG